MKIFVIVAALMAAIAAAAVALPLLRTRQTRLTALFSAVLVAGAAAGLYPLWSNWDWHAPPPLAAKSASPEIAAMVGKLEQHLRDQPADQKGWIMLGRAYAVLERPADAAGAYRRAYALGPDPDAATGLAEALSLLSGGQITPEADKLLEEALALAPGNPKALFYGGLAAAVRGQPALAKERWMALKNLHPPPQIEQMLDARIAELGPLAGPGTNASEQGTSAQQQASAEAQVVVNIRLAPALKARVTNDTPLFVFARDPSLPGPPLAVKRLTAAAIGTQVSLSSRDSMMPGRALRGGQKVSVTARVSFSGSPTPVSGDLYGESAYEVGHAGALTLVIDRVAQ
jgi:cytochrome c-type biogenesis protein CcmH